MTEKYVIVGNGLAEKVLGQLERMGYFIIKSPQRLRGPQDYAGLLNYWEKTIPSFEKVAFLEQGLAEFKQKGKYETVFLLEENVGPLLKRYIKNIYSDQRVKEVASQDIQEALNQIVNEADPERRFLYDKKSKQLQDFKTNSR